MSLPERQAELVDTHRAIRAANLPFVLVGGWAVSAFQTRFTTDVDMVLPEAALDAYDELLSDLGYTTEFDVDVSNVYRGRMVRYEKSIGDHTVEFDALVDALRCRQTDAEWSYRYLEQHSRVESLDIADDLSARIPEPALLFTIKLHSGRLADTRDLVVVGADAELDRVSEHVRRGEFDELAAQIETVLARLESPDFKDSFKGVFRQQSAPEDEIDTLIEFLSEFRDSL